MFASQILGPSDKNYSQVDKDGLAIVYGVVHFLQYNAGRYVPPVTELQPLLRILGSGNTLPQVLSPRVTRWFSD